MNATPRSYPACASSKHVLGLSVSADVRTADDVIPLEDLAAKSSI